MAAPSVNGRLHLTGVHQKPPASFRVSKNNNKELVCFGGLTSNSGV